MKLRDGMRFILEDELAKNAHSHTGRISEILGELLDALPGKYRQLINELEELEARRAWDGVEVALAFGIRLAGDPMFIAFEVEDQPTGKDAQDA